MIKKLLLLMMLCVTTFVGAWGQDGTPLTLEVGSTTYIYGYQFNLGGTYGPSVIQWSKEDKAGTTTTLVSVTCDDPAVTATLSDGTTSITVNSACSNVPVKFNFKKTETIWEGGNSHIEDYDEGVATFLITANANICTWTIDQTPITIDVSATQDRDFTFNTVWEKNDGSSTIQSVLSNNTSVATITNFSGGKSFSIHPVAKGQTEITITAACGSQTDTKTLIVNVTDKSLADEIIVDAEKTDGIYTTNVTTGSTSQVTVHTTPEDAVKSLKDLVKKSGSDNITVQSFDKNSGVITFAATYAEIGDEATFTISGKENSTAEDVDIKVTVIAPKAADGITLKVNGVTVDDATTQNLVKGGTFTIVPQVTPGDAADKSFSWNDDYDASIISIAGNVVTALKHGTTTLQATSTDGSFTTPIVTINVTEAFEGTLNVPASPRVGATGLKATLNITNDAIEEDYTAVYSSNNTEAVEVNASTGALTLKAQGNAKITAVLTPTTTGTAKGFTGATFESANITVGAPITANWTGNIVNTTLSLGSVNHQTSEYPQVSWSEEVSGAQTIYTVESDNEEVVYGQFGTFENNYGLSLCAKKPGTANVTIKAEYGYYEYPNNVQTWVPITSSTFGPLEVNVSALTGELTLSSSSDLTMDVADDNTTIDASANWSGASGYLKWKVVSSESSVASATSSGEDGANIQITINPESVGQTTVTVTSIWKKDVYNPIAFTASQEITKTFTVTVNDKTAANSLSVAPTANVAKGYSTELDVTFAPETANGFTYSVTGNSGVSAELSSDFKKLTIYATAEASTSEHATVTIFPKSGSTAPAATVDVTVVDPVGIEFITLVPSSATPLVGEKVTLVPTFNPEEPASKHLSWESDNTSVATVDENGVVTAIARGTATITATSDVINGEPAVTTTATITVKEELAPAADVRPKSTLRLGEKYDSELTLTNASLGTFSYESDATDIISVASNGTLTAKKVGTANITVTINPTTEGTAANYVAWTRTMPMTVAPAEFGLTLAAEPIKVSSATGGTINVTPAVTLNDVATDNTAYTIEYTLEGATSGVTINNSTGQVTIPASTPVQQFAVVATLTPDDKDNYKGAVGKAAVLVEGTASAGINLSKSTITVKDADGNDVVEELVIVNVPTPGAFGSLNEETITSTIDETTLQMLKDAKNVKVTGLLANSDVQKLVTLIGKGATQESKCEYIDMGDAAMTEAITSDGTKCSLVGETGYALESAKTVILPRPAIGVTNGTVLPANTNKLYTNVHANSQTALTTLVIPEGWTELADCFSSYNNGASYNGTVGVGNSACLTLTSLTLPNSLEKIGAYAFSSLQVKTLYMPTNLQRIAKYAFDPCTKLQDVYFTGPAPKYVDTFAFGGETQMCNNTVDDNQLEGEYDPVITRHEYHKLDVYACILHYPSEYEEDYIDTSRKYTVIPADMPYAKGNSTAKNTYYLPGWSDAKIAEVNEKKLGAMTLATYEQDFGVKDKTYGHSFIWPSQSQMATGYLIARAGYQWSGDPLRTADQYDPSATYENGGVDKRGLYQFIVGMGNAPKDQNKWVFPTDYEKGLWYTFSIPFDMTVEQIKKVFGEKTQVCRISKVVRDTSVNPNILNIEFRNSVMEEDDDRPKDIKYVENELDASGNTVSKTYTQAGIRHHWPYMIKPGGSVEDIKENDATFYEDGKRILPNYETVTGILRTEVIVAEKKDGTKTPEFEYMYCPILMKGKIKKNSYVLTKNKTTGHHEFGFYKGVKVKNADGTYKMENGKYVYEDGGTASANSAYVQLMHGQADFDTYFPSATINQSKVSFASIFGGFELDEEKISTEIEQINIICGNDDVNAESDKIYTINGVLVNGKSLAPGLYIKNGKKFIVR